MSERRVVKIVTGQPTSDGAGVRLTRVIGTEDLDHLDPFLLPFVMNTREEILQAVQDYQRGTLLS